MLKYLETKMQKIKAKFRFIKIFPRFLLQKMVRAAAARRVLFAGEVDDRGSLISHLRRFFAYCRRRGTQGLPWGAYPLLILVSFLCLSNITLAADADCPSAARSGLTENFAGNPNGYIYKNTFTSFLNEAEIGACKSFCENLRGIFSQVGWYLYCKASSVSYDSGKKAGADASPSPTKEDASSETNSSTKPEVIPPSGDRYFEVGVQTPFSKAPINPDGSETTAGENILVQQWLADGYHQCDKDTQTNENCDFRCTWQKKSGSGLCENLTSGEAWRFIPATNGTGKWQQVVRGLDGMEILTTYTTLIYRWLAGFIGIVAVLLIVIGGIMISSAGANQEGMESGKKLITSALTGLVLLFVSSLILYTVNPNFFSQTQGVKEFEKDIGVIATPTTPSVVPTALQTGQYTHAEAVKILSGKFGITSTIGPNGVCSDRQQCKTSLEGIEKNTVNGLIALYDSCSGSGKWSITGASELHSHSSGSTHYSGRAFDIDTPNPQLTSCIPLSSNANTSKQVGDYKYWILNEGGHYHISINASNAP